MKKRLTKLLTVILSVILGLAGFAGCNLVTNNTARDLDQVVATVNVNQEENIYKKDLVMAYLNYGYYYVQYQGYTAEKVYNLILNNLVNTRIMVQVAYDKFENGDAEAGIATHIVHENEAKFTPQRYLTDEEITEAKYSAYKSINDLLDSYSEDTSKTEKKDTLVYEVRTVPTDAKNAEKDIDKAAYVKNIEDNGFDVTSTEYKRAAFNKVINLLKANNLLGSDYNGSIMQTGYCKQLLKNYYENEIIENYEEAVTASIKNNLSYASLQELYNSKLDTQKEWSNSDFVSALSSAKADSPILYSAYGTYGYVYNLLIGANDYQSAKITELQEQRTKENKDEAWYSAQRKDILAGTIAKDLRSSWILSGYDFDYASKKFTGDYTFAKAEGDETVAANSFPFQGEVKEVRAKTEDKDGVYSVESVKTFGLDEFIACINTYVYNDESLTPIDPLDPLMKKLNPDDIYAAYTRADKPVEYDAKINELLFAFSTDSGSLNTYKGYVIKPAVDGSASEEYVKTFGDAGRVLLAKGGSSYMVVASDYGYHFMFFSEVWNAGDGYNTLEDYLDTLGIDKGTATWEEYFNAQKDKWEDFAEENNFLYILANELISAKLSEKTTQSKTNIITEYRYGAHKDSTVIYKERFADLLG